MSKWWIVSIAFTANVWIACEKAPTIDKETMMANEVQIKVDRLTALKKEKCLETLFEEASVLVDSLLLIEAKGLVDTLLRPAYPKRPIRPGIPSELDSIVVAPLFPIEGGDEL